MCGISGIRSFAGPPDAELVQQMMAALYHRGPDGSGYYRDEQVALGHTRLAIVDTAGGAQPMTNEDGTVWVTFNGEIFNYVELTAQLRERGHTFRTRSDTEVIVHAWEEWGAGCFERFNGQWALALWDRRAGSLVLSRDRFGVRPLYYTRVRDRLLFASEVKALLVDADVPRALDPAGLDQVFTFWSTLAPRTAFEGISQVRPGSYAVIGPAGRIDEQRYWSPTFPDLDDSRSSEPSGGQSAEEAAHALRETIVEAARLRFTRSDGPVGAYLSGGLDSAVTASVVAGFTDAPLHTFSLRFADDEFDEGGYQQLMAQRLGTQHDDVVVDERDIAEIFPEVVRHAETPLLRTAPAPMFLLSRLVRDAGYKVVVTGEGADEVLGGYDIFREARVRELWTRDPAAAEAAVERLYPWMRRSPNQAPAFARSFFGRHLDPDDLAMSHRPRWDSTSVLKSMLTDQMRVGDDAAGDLASAMPAGSRTWDVLSRAQWLEMATLLPGYILASQGDRMLMGNSVEGRFPFLDPRVAELAARVPADLLMRGLDEKHLLKRAFADLVPAEILARPKQPYRAPDAAAFFAGGGAPEWLEEVTSSAAVEAAGVFRPELIERLVAKCRRGSGRGIGNTDSMRLVAVASIQLLHHDFLAGMRPAGRRRRETPTVVHDRLRTPEMTGK